MHDEHIHAYLIHLAILRLIRRDELRRYRG